MQKKNSKKKYDNLKPDGAAYDELVSEYERDEMPDYSFKNRSQAMGANARKLRRMRFYFIIAVIKGVNSREQVTTAQYVEIIEPESTTVPEGYEESQSLPAVTEQTTTEETSDD